MSLRIPSIFAQMAAVYALFASAPLLADAAERYESEDRAELMPYLQCVPYARKVSGVQIYGDAYTWWDRAAGRYQRGTQPRVGAVMAFEPYRNMRLGHVAAVSRVVDSRTVLLSHANWSPINGRRGQIEREVKAVDVSPANDWSEVRVWYDPIQALGTTAWPVSGFIYSERATLAKTEFETARSPMTQVSSAPSPEFSRAFAKLGTAKAQPPARRATAPVRTRVPTINRTERGKTARDAIGAALARYD